MSFFQQCIVSALPVFLTWIGLLAWFVWRQGAHARESLKSQGARLGAIEKLTSAHQSKLEFYDHWFVKMAMKAKLQPWATEEEDQGDKDQGARRGSG